MTWRNIKKEKPLIQFPSFKLDLRGEKITLGPQPWIMGILNVTPDSFFDGGKFFAAEKAVDQALTMVEQGARIVDIGGESSRPGAREVPAEEELKRIIPVIKNLRPKTRALISIDTRKSQVARAALEEGADMVNDISALSHDPEMAGVVSRYQVPVALMHMLGTPETMQIAPQYDDVFFDIKYFFVTRIRQALEAGIPEDRIIIDPGIGFGKNLEHNLKLINNLDYFADLGKPILIGTSRKSFIGGILGTPVDQRLEGTIASVLISVIRGASLIRVHDVLAVKRALQVAASIINERRVAE
jgi:dihydropteroate synthase